MGTAKRPPAPGQPVKTDTDEPAPGLASTAATAPPPAKRQRVSRACDQCRNAREKCDGIKPACFPCASQNRDCTWQEPNRKRGVQTGYIRTLEASLGWIFDKFPGAEDALHGLITHQGGQGAALLADRQTPSSSRLHRRWMRSSVRKDIDLALSGRSDNDEEGARPPRGLAKDMSAQLSSDEADDGAFGNIEMDIKFSGRAEDSALPAGKSQQAPGMNSTTDPSLVLLPAEPHSHLHKQNAQLPPLRLPPNHWRLLDVYFAYTHAWFPVAEKPELLRTVYAYPSHGLSLTRHEQGSGAHAELWAVFAVAAHQDFAWTTAEGQSHGVEQSPDDIYRTARNLIPLENGTFEIGHINALVLLSQISLGRQNLTAAWMLTGMAVRIALRLGLHRASHPSKSRRQTHAFMGCFILDSLISAMLSSPPHLRSSDVSVAVSAPESDLDEWQPWNPCVGFGSSGTQAALSRNPAHTISSFVALSELHRVLTSQLHRPATHKAGLMAEELLPPDSPYLAEPLSQQAYREFVIAGEPLAAPNPPAYMLRLAYLCIEARISSAQNARARAHTLAACANQYVETFGICGLPPLFSSYLYIAGELSRRDGASPQLVPISADLPAAARRVWDPSGTANAQAATHPGHSPYPQGLHDLLLENNSKTQAQQQLPTPTSTSYQADAISDAANYKKAGVTRDAFQAAPPTSSLLNYGHDAGPMGMAPPNMDNSVLFDQVDLANSIASGAQFLAAHRPSFGSTGNLDHDAILDDLALIDRPDMIESESLFMANLGFPATHVAHYPQDFMEFS
ncbi:fungal-specific transcription factor domain-containing protein [Microdochium trichocladiopsis]|uniref:Fungal-specific transcription factor domain-containing protein n=1 Tax=Microdochium trichocladiopsis TaxID=1682393 RepID=A0A9P8XS03_9PEZI|nr:fungal-specific transcription factor domain-containing protein [Microdochium trichocladiopsis]KAH7014333.1 fungal-specific transcription factor domain-containing protein [Microdochium trichocladiopsis]